MTRPDLKSKKQVDKDIPIQFAFSRPFPCQETGKFKHDQSISRYWGQNCKYYYIPLFSDSPMDPKTTLILGAKSNENQSPRQISASLIKAVRSYYSHVKIPFDRIDPLLKWTSNKSLESGLGVVLQICTSFLLKDELFQALLEENRNFEIEWVFDFSNRKIEERFSQVSKLFEKSHLSIPLHKDFDWSSVTNTSFFKKFPEIHLYFGLQNDLYHSSRGCGEVNSLVRILKKNQKKDFLPPKGVCLRDPRVQKDLDMEPFFEPCFRTNSKNPKIKYSIVIPAFNNEKYLQIVLKHLYRQTTGVNSFEVILVDDGSTDQTQTTLIRLLKTFKEPMNFKYIFSPRQKKRTMGDGQYRAGISRNLGAKNAKGEFLCFLDSDIVVPKNYLEKVSQALKTYDMVQAKRENLCEKASSMDFEYDLINKKSDLAEQRKYWKDFNKTKDWSSLPHHWRYTYTNSLSTRRELFWKLGGLRKNFIFYGFEDTDFGYCLAKSGYKMHLLDMEVFHLFHKNTRSEFFNLQGFRNILLTRTAHIFYLNHLAEDIYEVLLRYMRPEPTINAFIKYIFNLCLRPFGLTDRKVHKSLKSVYHQQNGS